MLGVGPHETKTENPVALRTNSFVREIMVAGSRSSNHPLVLHQDKTKQKTKNKTTTTTDHHVTIHTVIAEHTGRALAILGVGPQEM